jgi:quinol monooxygenase YgiN
MAAALWGCAERQRPQEPLVRIAELEIDAAHLASYKAAVTEEIETSIRVEPGVLAIYSVTLKDNPTHVRFLEIYADDSAYRSHLESAHFKKYVEVTKSMIVARSLLETIPVVRGSKGEVP